MHPQLARALEPVLRDLRATGGPVPEVVDEPWDPDPAAASALLRGRGDGGSGTNLALDRPLPEQVARVTEQVQEWAIEEL